MEYSNTWWLSFYISILTSYILGGWINTDINIFSDESEQWYVDSGDGPVILDGSHCLIEDGKPYNSGDPRAG